MSLRLGLLACASLAALVTAPGTASATCDGCCDLRARLAGWSADGTRWAVTYEHDAAEEELVIHDAGGGAQRWSAFDDRDPDGGAEPMCVAATPRLPGRAAFDADRIDVSRWRPLRRFHLVATQAAWRTAFDDAVTVATVGHRTFRADPFGLGLTPDHICLAYELRAADGRVLATLPRDCAEAEPIGRLHVVGGYLHPDGKTALVKVFISRVRLVTETRFLRIDMR